MSLRQDDKTTLCPKPIPEDRGGLAPPWGSGGRDVATPIAERHPDLRRWAGPRRGTGRARRAAPRVSTVEKEFKKGNFYPKLWGERNFFFYSFFPIQYSCLHFTY